MSIRLPATYLYSFARQAWQHGTTGDVLMVELARRERVAVCVAGSCWAVGKRALQVIC